MLATGKDLCIITAHPFDLSASRREAAIKKAYASPVYRLVIEADEEAQDLALKRAKMHIVAQAMGAQGLPRQEFNPEKTDFPCGYCEWKSLCIAKRNEFGLVFPEIPDSYGYQMDLSEVALV